MKAWIPRQLIRTTLLSLAIGITGAGCDDDDDKGGSVTASGSSTSDSDSSSGGDGTSGANPPASQPAAGPDDSQMPAADPNRLTAPDALLPADGGLYEISQGTTKTVTFQWSAVPNAISYHVEVHGNNGTTRFQSSNTTSLTMTLPPGTYRWNVHASAYGAMGPYSGDNTFTVQIAGGAVG